MGADEIKSQGLNLKELFHDVSYQIDYYQRDYTWGEEEVGTLLRDLCGTFRNWSRDHSLLRRPGNAPQYFLGPFVYYEPSRHRRGLVDGQQRFVTLHLTFLHLRARAKDLGYDRPVDRLNRAITTDGHNFAIGISDHEPVLRAISEGRMYETGLGDSLSRRNLWARSQQIVALLAAELDSESLTKFVDWLLDRVVLVGIRAADQSNGYRMFESMNDRGARLTAVDLLKSYLLSNVGSREDELNTRWQEMLRELATDREDTAASSRFIKAVLLARYGRTGNADDRRRIDTNLNVWIRRNAERLGLRSDRPEQFMRFVTDLLDTARLFRPFLAASRELKDEDSLETVLFNERNGLGAQTVAVLAAIRPSDVPTVAKEKGRLVANFIDRWYALRVLQDLAVQSSDIAELVHTVLVPDLRKCRTVSEVAHTLGELAAQESVSMTDSITFGLRGNNGLQVRYLLARTTAFVEHGCERDYDILAYLDWKQFHIEHLWAKHHSRVEPEIPDPVVFRTRRNQLGGLGLLRGRENSSFNDLPLAEKIPLYPRHNTLLGILAADFDVRNPALRRFARANKLEGLLRRFGPNDSMTVVVKTRQDLYLKLCEIIWNPERLGFTVPPRPADPEPTPTSDQTPAQPRTNPTPRRIRRRQTDVAKMVETGVLKPGTEIVLTYRSVDHWATIDEDGGIVLKATGGTAYGRVDEAGAVARGTKTCQGMNEWRVEDEQGLRVSLRILRDRAQVSGLLGRSGR